METPGSSKCHYLPHIFFFLIISNTERSCKYSTKSFSYPNHSRVSCQYSVLCHPWILQCLFPVNKDVLLYNRDTTIKVSNQHWYISNSSAPRIPFQLCRLCHTKSFIFIPKRSSLESYEHLLVMCLSSLPTKKMFFGLSLIALNLKFLMVSGQ